MKTLTTYFIVKNEEANIRDCINSILSFSDEIIITDTGSIDNTKDVALSFENEKIKIYDFEWCNNYSKARNFSLSKATCDYVLSLDADEVVNEELQNEIKKLKSSDFLGFEKILIPGFFTEQQNRGNPNFHRFIVSRELEPSWVYPVHEALKYKREPKFMVVNNGKIINNKKNNEILVNFDKYCEMYFNEFNSKIDYKKGGEFYYYVSFTIAERDVFLSKTYLSKVYNKEAYEFGDDLRLVTRFENRQSKDESVVLYLINSEKTLEDKNLIKSLYDMTLFDDVDEFAKYYILKYFYDNKDNEFIKEYLPETNVKLSLIELKYHNMKKFIEYSKGTYLEHDAFRLNEKAKNMRVIIKSDNCPSTLLYYASKYFYDICLISNKKNINHDFDNIEFKFLNGEEEIPNDGKRTLYIISERQIYTDEFDDMFTTFLNSNDYFANYFG